MKVKTTIGGVQLELEAKSQVELEFILETAVKVAQRMEMTYPYRLQTDREQKTLPENVSVSPPQPEAVGGNSPLSKPLITTQTIEVIGLYENAKTIAERVEVALAEMGKKMGTRYYSYGEILNFLRETGGDEIVKDTKDPIQAIRQAIRNKSQRFERDTTAGTVRLPEWKIPQTPLYSDTSS